MRWATIQTVLLKEVREMLRDRRSLLVMFGLPLVLYPVLTLALAGLEQSKQKEHTQETAVVAVNNSAAAPHLMEMLAARKDRFEVKQETDVRAALTENRVHAVITIPDHFEADLLADAATTQAAATTAATMSKTTAPSETATTQAATSAPGTMAAVDENTSTDDDEERPATQPAGARIHVAVDSSRSNTPFVEEKLDELFRQYKRWVIEQRLAAHQVPPSVLDFVEHKYDEVATEQQRMGKIFAMMLPLLLLMTGMLGAFFPALNATTTERELGTLETLLVTPASRLELLTAKGILVVLSGLLTAGLNMVSMSLVLWYVFAQGGQKLGLSAIGPGQLCLTYLAAVPTLLFFSAFVLIVGLIARNFREANSFSGPVMMLPLVATFVGMAEPKTSVPLMLTPVVNTTLIIHDVLTARASMQNFLLAFCSSLVYAGLMLSVAVRLFSNEQLVNPAWEPVSFKIKRGGLRGLPNIDGALALFCVVLLAMFYANGLFFHWHWNVLEIIAGTQIALILAPTLGWAAVARYRWQSTFSLRPASAGQYTAAVLIGLGMIPVATWLQGVQNYFLKTSEIPETTRLIAGALADYPILLPILAGLLAGVCEELLFRGVIQRAFVRRLPPVLAICIVAALFSALHMDFQGALLRFGLGILLGWMTWRSGSIYVSMIAHGLFDAVQLGYFSWQLAHEPGAATQLAATRAAVTQAATQMAEAESPFVGAAVMWAAAGAVAAAAGIWILAKSKRVEDKAEVFAAPPTGFDVVMDKK